MDISIIFALCIFIAIYGGLHYYLYRKLIIVVPAHKRATIILLIILASSVIVVEVMTHVETAPFILPIAWISFFWMGLVVLFFGLSVPIDLLTLIARRVKASNLTLQLTKFLDSPTRHIALLTLVLLLAVYGSFSAQKINIKKIELYSEKINRPLQIVQISDLHIGGLTREDHILHLIDTINHLNPDLIVSTGDLIDMSTDNSEKLVSILAKLKSKLGKFAVYGNHETFAGLEKSLKLTELAGFTLLSNRGVTLDGVINLFGVDDPSVVRSLQADAPHPDKLIPHFSNTLYTILLKHQPLVATNTISRFDLQLSGHVHGGQIFPYGLLTWAYYRLPMGMSQIEDGTLIYVSYGTGTWGPPMRVFAPAEVTLIQLQPGKE